MAKRANNLTVRILAALVFAPALLGLVVWGGVALDITCAVLALLMLYEYLQLTLGKGLLYAKGVAFVLTGAVVASLLGYVPVLSGLLLPAATIVLLASMLAGSQPMEQALRRAALIALGIGYCGGLVVYLARLRQVPQGLGLALAAVFCTWGADTGAYFAGRAFGRHKLAPRVSPKKTIEGAVGGVAAAVGVAFLIRWLFVMHLGAFDTVAIGVVAGILGIVGDLCESLLKRSVGAKDSSRLIPGHGGVLDRFDAVMFVAPALFIYVDLFIRP